MEELTFPTFDYYLDQSDPDVVILRRQEGSFVAAFSARGATKEGILEAAEKNRRELIQARTNPLGPRAVIVAPVTEGTPNHGTGVETLNQCLLMSTRENEQHKLHVD
jgi:hypothetical protein